jgi:RNA polymerase sigma factor (sigma-70 family)
MRGDRAQTAVGGGVGSPVIWDFLLVHRERLVRLVGPHCATPADAEDCVHDALIEVALRRDIDPARVGGLLRTVALRRAVDIHRRRHIAHRAMSRLGIAGTRAPDELAIDRAEALRLAGHAGALSPQERRVLAARADGFGPRETAQLLGVSSRTATQALCRARAHLKRMAGPVVALLLWLRRRTLRPSPHLAPFSAAILAAAIAIWAVPPAAPQARVPAPQSPQLASPAFEGLETAAPPKHHAPPPAAPGAHPSGAAAPPAPGNVHVQVQAWVGSRDVAGVPLTLQSTHNDKTFAQALVDCLTPGGFSIDLRHAGC